MSLLRKTKRFMIRIDQNGARLEGWSFIQEKVLSHDEDMLSDYADDIDTLLVFVSTSSSPHESPTNIEA